MRIIGLTGAAGVGKDSVGEVLVRAGWVRMAFADPLRAGLYEMFGIKPVHFEREHKERPIDWLGGRSPRDLMQTLGTEWGRQLVCSDVWSRVAERRFLAVEQSGNGHLINGVVFTDVRFPNEAEMILRRGGVIWRVERPGIEPVRAHVSETAAAGIEADRIVVNDGTLLDLEMRVSETLRRSFL